MNETEMRIAIAQACGWTNIEPLIYGGTSGAGVGLPPHGNNQRKYLPDYPNDLNAMYEAIQALKAIPLLNSAGKQIKDCTHSLTLYDEYQHFLIGALGTHGAIDATARKRSEAFLRVKGLWKE